MDENRYTPELRFEGFTEPWKQQELGNIAKIVAGGDVDKRRLRPTGKYSVLANALTNDGIVGYYDDSYRIEAPAVTVTGRGEVGHAKARFAPFTPVVRLLAVITKSDVSFIAEAINLTNIALESTGVPQLTVPQLASVQLRIPDTVEEQQAIGTFFHKLDSLIALQQRKYERLQHLKQALLRKMFPKPGEQVPELRFEGFTEPWKRQKLGDIAEVTMGQSPNGSCYTDNPEDPILVQGNADLRDGWVFPRVWTTQVTKTARAGDLIMSVRAPVGAIGKTAYDVVLGRGVCGIKGNEFLFQFLSKLELEKYWFSVSTGSTFDSINGDELRATPIFMPTSIQEQEAIGSLLSRLDSFITLYQRKYERLQHLKQALLQRMFV